MPNGSLFLIYYFLLGSFCMHDLIIQFLAFVRECIELYIELWHQIDEGIDPAFSLEELVQHHHFLFLQNTIAALEGSPFITDHVAALLDNPFYFIQRGLCVFHTYTAPCC